VRRAQHELIVVMPVFEDRESASILLADLRSYCPKPPFVVVVDDGSIRDPMSAGVIAAAGLAGEVLHLARNMGHQRAIATGLSYVAGNFEAAVVVVMDSDGEDSPTAIPALLNRLQVDKTDLVVAQRRKRSESLRFRSFYVVYRMIFQLLTGRKIQFGNFAVLSSGALHRLVAMHELWVHFPASLIVSRLRVGAVPTDRAKRYAGQSQMRFVALVLHGLRSMMVFADDVLVRVVLFCVVLACSSVVLLALSAVLKLFGFATPGWFTSAAGSLMIILLQAGILIFVTLMISGMARSASPVTKVDLDLLIREIEPTSGLETGRVTRMANDGAV
jgi:hypothetical protein